MLCLQPARWLAVMAATLILFAATLRTADPAALDFDPQRLERLDAMIQREIDAGKLSGAVAIWTGDLDLATDDASRLVKIAEALGTILFVHNEASFREEPGESPAAFALAVVTGSGIEVSQWGMSYVSDAMRAGQLQITRTAPNRSEFPRRRSPQSYAMIVGTSAGPPTQ